MSYRGFLPSIERTEIRKSKLDLTKIDQYKYFKDSKKINDRSGSLEKR
jgi:hypothetical protein